MSLDRWLERHGQLIPLNNSSTGRPSDRPRCARYSDVRVRYIMNDARPSHLASRGGGNRGEVEQRHGFPSQTGAGRRREPQAGRPEGGSNRLCADRASTPALLLKSDGTTAPLEQREAR